MNNLSSKSTICRDMCNPQVYSSDSISKIDFEVNRSEGRDLPRWFVGQRFNCLGNLDVSSCHFVACIMGRKGDRDLAPLNQDVGMVVETLRHRPDGRGKG